MPAQTTNIKYTTQCRRCWGKGKAGFGTVLVTCSECNGTGQITGFNLCKYCMEPCDGYCCKSCFRSFEV